MPPASYYETRGFIHRLLTPQIGGPAGIFVDWFIIVLIAANVIAVMLETVDPIFEAFPTFFWWFEVVSVAVFTIEYLGRVWTAVEFDEYQGIISGRVRFASRFLLVIDLLAILPFYLTVFGVGIDLRFLRAIRLVRFLRLLKLARYSRSMLVFVVVFRNKKEDLVLAFFVNMLLLILASSMMYYIEHPHQPEVFSSIPETLYWGLITLTTVGYGDVVPVTLPGQFFAGIIALLGIGLFALPASILASGFMEEARSEHISEYAHCPHCGEPID